MQASQIQDFLQQYVRNFDFIESIVVSDKEGIEIFAVYRDEKSVLKENQANTMFVAGLNGSNENLLKLNQTKINNLTLFYDNFIVYLETAGLFVVTLFCKCDCNLAIMKQLAEDIIKGFAPLSQELDKIGANKP